MKENQLTTPIMFVKIWTIILLNPLEYVELKGTVYAN